MKRVFTAIDISDEARAAIRKYVDKLRSEFSDLPVRWEKLGKLHLTVKFAGSLDEEELKNFKEEIKATAASIAPFRIAVVGTGAFVWRRGPSVLWLAIQVIDNKSDPFATIASKLYDGGAKRPFKPHLTIARTKDSQKATIPIDRHLASHFEPVEFDVNELVIYESTLLPSGSVYAKIANFALGACGL